jgi:hypothetical protein
VLHRPIETAGVTVHVGTSLHFSDYPTYQELKKHTCAIHLVHAYFRRHNHRSEVAKWCYVLRLRFNCHRRRFRPSCRINYGPISFHRSRWRQEYDTREASLYSCRARCYRLVYRSFRCLGHSAKTRKHLTQHKRIVHVGSSTNFTGNPTYRDLPIESRKSSQAV